MLSGRAGGDARSLEPFVAGWKAVLNTGVRLRQRTAGVNNGAAMPVAAFVPVVGRWLAGSDGARPKLSRDASMLQTSINLVPLQSGASTTLTPHVPRSPAAQVWALAATWRKA